MQKWTDIGVCLYIVTELFEVIKSDIIVFCNTFFAFVVDKNNVLLMQI